MRSITLIAFICSMISINAQDKMDDKVPYSEIPEYSDNYTAGTVSARMIDGLGFRYYWATNCLTEKDLNYKPSEEARTTLETIDHIYDLSQVIVNSTLHKINNSNITKEQLTYAEKRTQTLLNFKIAADILRASDDISIYKIIFKGENGIKEFPFWNQINGPIEDAVWHCGQIVSFRRASGNPYNSKASLFTGKLRE